MNNVSSAYDYGYSMKKNSAMIPSHAIPDEFSRMQKIVTDSPGKCRPSTVPEFCSHKAVESENEKLSTDDTHGQAKGSSVMKIPGDEDSVVFPGTEGNLIIEPPTQEEQSVIGIRPPPISSVIRSYHDYRGNHIDRIPVPEATPGNIIIELESKVEQARSNLVRNDAESVAIGPMPPGDMDDLPPSSNSSQQVADEEAAERARENEEAFIDIEKHVKGPVDLDRARMLGFYAGNIFADRQDVVQIEHTQTRVLPGHCVRKVFRVDTNSEEQLFLKTVRCSKAKEAFGSKELEVYRMEDLNGRYIPKLLACDEYPIPTGNPATEKDYVIYEMLMEYAGVTLASLKSPERPVAYPDVLSWMMQSAEALAQLGKKRVFHSRISLQTLYVLREQSLPTERGSVATLRGSPTAGYLRVGGLRNARVLSPADEQARDFVRRFGFAEDYPCIHPPELMTEAEFSPEKMDIYCWGWSFLTLLTGRAVAATDIREEELRIDGGTEDQHGKLKEIIRCAVAQDPKARRAFAEILKELRNLSPLETASPAVGTRMETRPAAGPETSCIGRLDYRAKVLIVVGVVLLIVLAVLLGVLLSSGVV